MDWLTFKFCVLIWVLCVSKSKSQSQLLHSTSSLSNQLRSACEAGQPIVPPDECNTCICFAGQIYCTNIPCPEQDCFNGVDLPQPDACNKCICRRGKVICSNMICIPAQNCAENQLYPAQNKCNACICLNGFIKCTSNPCAEEPLFSTIPTGTKKKPKKKKCIEGDSLAGPNECTECFCQNGKKRCKYMCNPTLESRFSQGPECVPGQYIPRPDDCNNCICFEGQIHCTHLPCRMDTRIGPECTDNQAVFRPDECNECYCFDGQLECSDLVCIRGSKCVQGQVIPKPDSCNACICVEGRILCTNYQCPMPNSRNTLRPVRSSKEVRTLDECQEGDVIPPPPPPSDCNTCYCMDNRILCTTSEGAHPEIKGRLREPCEETDFEIFDKKNSVVPFINMLSKNHEKLPTKLIHTHAYNGFHQEIKLHASHLPKDATKLLKVLATSLDNSVLASISQRLLTSPTSLSNDYNSEIPLDHQVVQTKLLGEGYVLHTQSSKLITAGSQSNETISVIPNNEPFDDTLAVLPLTSKQETIWKSVSSPASLVFNNNQQTNPPSSQEEKLNVFYYDNPPSMFTSIDQNNMIHNPSKFSRPGLLHMKPTKTTRNTEQIPKTNIQSIYPVSKPKSINIKDGKMSYAPLPQENKQFKPTPSDFVSNRDELLSHLRPYQLIKPGQNQVFNYTSSTPIFRPGKFLVTPNNDGGQQKPLQSQFIPNLSKYYPNHVKPQQIQFKPNQNHLTKLNNKSIQHPPLFPNNPNQPIVAANQYKQPQFGLKPGQVSISPLNNKGYQTNQQINAFPPRFQVNSPLINLPTQNKRISSVPNEDSKEIPPHSMVPNFTAHQTNTLNTPHNGVDLELTKHKSSHSQFVPNPSIYYRNEYEAPKIIEVNPDQEQLLIPHSNISYTHIEHYHPPHTSSEGGDDILIRKVRNDTRKYNTTHSHEKHTTITYVSEYDPTHPGIPLQIVHDPNQNTPQNNIYELYLPDQETQELDLIMSKVNYYLNLPNLQLDQNEAYPKLTQYHSSQTSFFPGHRKNYTLKVHTTMTDINKYNQHDPWNITHYEYQFDKYPHSPDDGKNTDLIKSYQNRTTPTNPMYHIFTNYSHFQHSPGMFDEHTSADGSQYPSNSAENPTHSRGNLHNPKLNHFGPTQLQHLPGTFNERGSTDGFHYPSNLAENPLQTNDKLNKLLHKKFGPTQNQQLPRVFDERGSADGFQYPSSAENPAHLKENMHKLSSSLFGPTAYKQLPGKFNGRGSLDNFQYYDSAKNPLNLIHNLHILPRHQYVPTQNQHKQTIHKQSNFPIGPTQNQHLAGMFDEHRSTDELQYPSYSAENPLQSKDNQHNAPHPQLGPTQNQQIPEEIDERGSANGYQYPSNSVKNPRENLHKLLQSQCLPSSNQHASGVFDDRGSVGGFRYSSNSAEESTHPKGKPPHFPLSPTQNQHLAEMFGESGSADGFQYPSYSAESPLEPKDHQHNPPNHQFSPNQNQHTPEVFDDRGSANGFHYPTNSVENPTHYKNNPNTTPESKFTLTQNQPKPSSLYDGDNNNNPLRPWMHLEHDHNKPSSFDNLSNGVHNIPWSFSGDHNNDSESVTSAPKPRFTSDFDQYKQSSFDNLLNGIRQILWSLPNQDNNALASNAEITTPRSGFKTKHDQYGPSMVNNPSISNQNENTALTDENDYQLKIEQDVSTPSTELTDSYGTQYQVLPKLKPDCDPNTLLPTDDGKIPDNYDQSYPLFKAVKKLSDPPIDNSVFSVGSMDQLDLLPFLFPGIAEILNYKPSQDQDDVSPVENHEVQRINPLSKLKSKLNQPFPENDNGILNWLKRKLVPTKDNATVTKNNIDMTKIFNLIFKLMPPKLKHTTALQNIPFSSFDSEIIEKIMNDFKEENLTTTLTDRTDSTHSYENRFKSDLTIPEKRQLKQPDVHKILHQSNDEDDLDLPPYIETDGERNLAIDIDFEELSASMFPKMFNPRFRYRPKDQKEECGDGTQWISNCHGCSCYFGQAMCFRLRDCELRSLGEPMTCKPYSHFKMGCYTCECNGDGVAECDATDCNTQPSGKSRVSGSTESPLPVFNEFLDNKKTNEILQYYNFYKKLPKDCSKQDLRTQYPTCERGTNWVSSCHKCECNESGKHECTKIEDCKLDVDFYGKPGRCKPNSKFYPKKNSMPCVECLCNDEGIPYCPAADNKDIRSTDSL